MNPKSASDVASRLASALRPRGPIHFELSEHQTGDETVIRAEGEVDLMTAPKLAGVLDRALRTQTGDVVVDLRDATFLDSTGLHVLLNAQRRLTRRSRQLRVFCTPGPVLHVIELARLTATLGVAALD